MMITGGVAHLAGNRNPESETLGNIESAVRAGVSFVQIREKGLSARSLKGLVKKSLEITGGTDASVLVNDRFDIALASGAGGVQLTSTSLEVGVVRSVCPDGFIIGASTHSIEEVMKAKEQGADFVLFGPVFDSPGKRRYGAPQGIAKLERVCRRASGFPVIAVGGIDGTNIKAVLKSGAAGYAAIRMYTQRCQTGRPLPVK